jgi:hypothetical protein
MHDRRAPPVGANQRAHSPPSLSLSHCTVGPTCRRWFPRVRPLSLSLPRRPHLSAVPNLSPTISRRGRAHVHSFSGHVRAPFGPRALLAHLSSLICALCPALSPSLSLCPRVQRTPPSPADAHCLFYGHRRARAPSSATMSFTLLSAARDTLRCALSLPVVSGPRSPEHLLRSRSPPPLPRRTLAPPPLLRDSSASA